MSATDTRAVPSAGDKSYEEVRKAWHAANVRPLWENPLAHNSLGAALERLGRIDEAVSHYSAAARIHSVYYHGAESAP